MTVIHPWVKRWHGVGLTAVVVALIHLVSSFTSIMTSLSLAFIPMSYTAYHSGLWPALTSALAVSLYAVLTLSPDRAIQIIIAAFMIAAPMGVLKRRARLGESADRNLQILHEAVLLVSYLSANWQDHDRRIVQEFFTNILDRLGNLEASVFGWKQVREERLEEERLAKQRLVSRVISDLDKGQS